jgi:hypothetical protein
VNAVAPFEIGVERAMSNSAKPCYPSDVLAFAELFVDSCADFFRFVFLFRFVMLRFACFGDAPSFLFHLPIVSAARPSTHALGVLRRLPT